MASHHESFFEQDSFAVIGHDKARPFPRLTYDALKSKGKTVYAVDTSTTHIGDDATFGDLGRLPRSVAAAVLEVPKQETASWVEKCADAGIRHVWIHMKTETPEALDLASRRELDVRSGTCAVQYLSSSFPHSVHKAIRKSLGRW